jgi:hypothetical protein
MHIEAVSHRRRRIDPLQCIPFFVRNERCITKYRHVGVSGFEHSLGDQLVPSPQDRLIAVFTHCIGDEPGKNMPGSVILP